MGRDAEFEKKQRINNFVKTLRIVSQEQPKAPKQVPPHRKPEVSLHACDCLWRQPLLHKPFLERFPMTFSPFPQGHGDCACGWLYVVIAFIIIGHITCFSSKKCPKIGGAQLGGGERLFVHNHSMHGKKL